MTIKPPKDPVSAYAEQVRARAAKRREATRTKVPNLVEADALHDPKRGATTVDKIGKAMEVMQEPKEPGGLSPDTMQGLAAIKQEVEAKRAQQQAEKPEEEPLIDPDKDKELKAKEKSRADDLGLVDDYEFEQLMSRVREDIINNKKQRKAIEARLSPIDLAKGIAAGEFTQNVPIHPNTLEVIYRTPTAFELQQIRIILVDICAENPKKESIATELYSAMTLAASIYQINTEKWPTCVQLTGTPSFNAELFMNVRVNKLLVLPAPLLHVIAVHGGWFDMRVRESLRVPALKDG